MAIAFTSPATPFLLHFVSTLDQCRLLCTNRTLLVSAMSATVYHVQCCGSGTQWEAQHADWVFTLQALDLRLWQSSKSSTYCCNPLALFTHAWENMQLRKKPIVPPTRQRLYTSFTIVFAGDDQIFCLPPSSFIENVEPQYGTIDNESQQWPTTLCSFDLRLKQCISAVRRSWHSHCRLVKLCVDSPRPTESHYKAIPT